MKNKFIIILGIILFLGAGIFMLIKTNKINLSNLKNSINKSSVNIDHVDSKDLSKMDLKKLYEDLDKEDKTLIRNEDGTYSSSSKKEATKYYKNYMNDIINDKEKAKKHQEQLAKDIDEGNPVIVTDEMKKAGLFIPIS